jgi:hypothetical protein
MKDKIVKAWASLSVAQGFVLVGVLGIAALTAIHLPPETWERIAEKDPADVGMRVGAFVLAMAGVFAQARPSSTATISARLSELPRRPPSSVSIGRVHDEDEEENP